MKQYINLIMKAVTTKRLWYILAIVALAAVVGIAYFSMRENSLSAAESHRYDKLIRSSSEWSAQHSMKEANKSRKKGDKGRAMVLYMNVIEKLHDDNSTVASKLKVEAYMNQGDIYTADGNHGEALDAYLKGLDISEASASHPHAPTVYRKIGAIHSLFRDYDKKRYFEMKGLQRAREQRDTNEMFLLLNNMVRTYVAQGNPRKARNYYSMLDGLKVKYPAARQYHKDYTEAMLVRCEGKIDEALKRFHNLAARNDSEKMDPTYKCSVYNEIFWIYNDMPQLQDSAEYYLRECIEMVKANGLSLLFMDEIKELSQLYERRGKEAEAMKWKLEYFELIDSAYVGNVRKLKDVRNRQFLNEMQKAETKIKGLGEEKRHHRAVITRQRWIIACSLAGVILAALIIWYIVRQNRRLTASYRSLYELNSYVVSNHRETMATKLALENENEQLRNQLAATSGSVASEAVAAAGDTDSSAAGEKEKYSSSNLGEDQKKTLARSITEVMESERLYYCNSDFSLGVLAERVQSNSRYVSQVINDVFGKSFNSYINEYRVREACRRLEGRGVYANYSVKGIGESVGFKSHSTFVGVFKKITGMAPSVYRKMSTM